MKSQFFLTIIATGCVAVSASAQDSVSDSQNTRLQTKSSNTGAEEGYSEEEQKQIQLTDRFLSVLEKSPRRGTALDRIYGHHIEFGTLDSFLAKLRATATAEPEDGAKWMVLGLFESQRGMDLEAVQSFAKAEEFRPTDALAPYYASQSFLRLGETDQAVRCLERAIAAKPPRADLMEIYQQLGRVLQRAQRPEEALKVWKSFEAEFPNDPRVLEQIALTLLEEGELDSSLERFERLIKLTKDDYKRTIFRASAAEVKIRSNERSEGIADLEAILGDLNPTSWLHRDIRRRIEQIFLRSGDQDGLVAYYEGWIAKNPEDVEGMTRLAKFLSSAARVPEAVTWMEKAIKLAPTRQDLRKAFIDQLIEQQRFDDADKEYSKLTEAAPENTDYYRDWGRLVLRNREIPKEAKEARVVQIWSKMLAVRPTDASLTAQVADLFRNANLQDQAIELYAKAIELAPDDPQYREYLGEYYQINNNSEKALETWAAISQPPRRTAINLTRLAEVYNSFGYHEKAILEITEACQLETKDFSLFLKAATYHARAEKFDEALAFLEKADAIASNDEQRGESLAKRIEFYQSSGELEEEIEKRTAYLKSTQDASPNDWYVLARLHEGNRDYKNANLAIEQAIQLEPKSILYLTAQARNLELAGDLNAAALIYRRLVDVDRRSRDEHWSKIARMEMELGRSDEALHAASQLILASPSNTDHYVFLSNLQLQLGKNEESLDSLRKAVRINPNEPQLLMALGNALSNQLETREAIELYWRAFEKSSEIDDKTSLTQRLVPLYEQLNQFEQLIERFKREGQEEDKRRDMTICLAQAYQTSGDIVSAKLELESLLSENSKDSNLLQQLAKLCSANGDMEQAIAYQRQLVAIAPGGETESSLAQMLQEAGEIEESNEIFVHLLQSEEDRGRQLRSIESLILKENYESAVAVLAPLRAQERDNWELLYLEALALIGLERPVEAQLRLQRILDLKIPFTTPSFATNDKLKKADAKAKSDRLRGIANALVQPPVLETVTDLDVSFLSQAPQIRYATKLMEIEYFNQRSSQPLWRPTCYGLARIAAFSWQESLRRDAQESNKKNTLANKGTTPDNVFENWVANLESNAKSQEATRNEIVDWIYMAAVLDLYDEVFDAVLKIAEDGGKAERSFLLMILPQTASATSRSSVGSQLSAVRGPLNDEKLDKLVGFYQEIPEDAESQQPEAPTGNILQSGGQAYVQAGNRSMPLSNLHISKTLALENLIPEIVIANRHELARELVEELLANAKNSSQLESAMSLMQAAGMDDRQDEVFSSLLKILREEQKRSDLEPSSNSVARQQSMVRTVDKLPTYQAYLGKLANDGEIEKLLTYADQILDISELEELQQRRVRTQATSGPNQSTRAQYNQPQTSTEYFQWSNGKSKKHIELPVLVNSPIAHSPDKYLLAQLYASLLQSDSVDILVSKLESRISNAPPEALAWRQIVLSTVLSWVGEDERAAELLLAAVSFFHDQNSAKYIKAHFHLNRMEFEAARDLIESIRSSDMNEIKQKEFFMLRVSERSGDTQRALDAAHKLFGLRLSAQEELRLIPSLKRIGLNSMADAILTRSQRNAGNQIETQASLMSLLQAQGKTVEAIQIARLIIQRTSSPYSNLGNMSSYPGWIFRGNQYKSQPRIQAIEVLKKTNELESIIAKLESQVERTPESLKLYEQLVEFLEDANRFEDVKKHVENVIRLRPKQMGWRWKLADSLEKSGDIKNACDQLLVITREDPSMVANDFFRIHSLFVQDKRIHELEKAIAECDLSSLKKSYMLSNMVGVLLSRGGESEVAISFLERLCNEFPSRRGEFLSPFIYNSRVGDNPRVKMLVLKSILPTRDQAARLPWYGMTEIRSFSTNKINTAANSVLEEGSTKGDPSNVMDTLAATIEEAPDWKAGQFMLAVLKYRTDEKSRQEALETIKTLISDHSMDSGTGVEQWIASQMLPKTPEMRPLAIKFMEGATEGTISNSFGMMQQSPMWQLTNLYVANGQPEVARNLILKRLKNRSRLYLGDSYELRSNLENELTATRKLVELGMNADAIPILVSTLRDKSLLESAILDFSNEKNFYTAQFESLLQLALSNVDSSNVEALLLGLLPEPSGLEPMSSFSVLQLVPQVVVIPKSNGRAEIQIDLQDIFERLGQDESVKKMIQNRLDYLHGKHPDKLSILLLHAIQHSTDDESIQKYDYTPLSERLDSHPVAPIEKGKRATALQQKEASEQVAYWLIAKKLLATSSHKELGETFANHALLCASRMPNSELQLVLLDEWASLVLSQRDVKKAAQLWTVLLSDLANRHENFKVPGYPPRLSETQLSQPGPNQNGDQDAFPASGAQVKTNLPPLTSIQFNAVIRIARQAATRNLPELSRNALREAFRGGLPISDEIPSQILSSSVAATSTDQPNMDASALDVGEEIISVVRHWKGNDYPPTEVYEILKDLILPAIPKDAVYVYPVVSSSLSASSPPQSVADIFIQSAVASEKSDEIEMCLDELLQSSHAKVEVLTLQALLGARANKPELARKSLSELEELVNKMPSDMNIELLKHAAFPCLAIPDLQAESHKAFETYLKRSGRP